MTNSDTLIGNVSDTALWVAYYRARETMRDDALFKDPLAHLLIGDRGQKIAEDMKKTSRYTEWTVTIRTVIIDEYIKKMAAEGVDTVVNLGAGLDTRPYRMDLPTDLKWIEADYPRIIAHKNKILAGEAPRCRLTRVEVDLADTLKRNEFLLQTALQSKKILVITEGVVVYLNEAQVSDLAEDLYKFPQFAYWIVEYMSPEVYRHLRSPSRIKKMRNAPFRFFPADWMSFFGNRGWVPKEVRYHGEEGSRLNRNMPMPKFASIFKAFIPKAVSERSKRMTGFALFRRKDAEA